MTNQQYGPQYYGPQFGTGPATNPARDARDQAAVALAAALDVPVMVHADIPANLTPPAVIVRPDPADWLTPATLSGWYVQLLATIVVAATDAESGLRRAETICADVLAAVDVSGPIQGPRVAALTDAPVLIVDIPMRYLVTPDPEETENP